MSIFKKVVKKVVKPATRKVVKAIGGNPDPGLGNVIKAAKKYNPVTGPIGAIKKVSKAMNTSTKPRQKRR